MPITTDSSLNNRASMGAEISPNFCRMMLIAPSLPSMGRQASTRIRKEVQNGMTQMTSRTVESVLLLTKRPTNSAVG